MPSCPRCHKAKWKTQPAPEDFRQRVLHCMECGFEVDVRVFRQSRRILLRDNGKDLRVDAVSES